MDTRSATWMLSGFFLLLIAGCARADWIESTLVTADVSGTWKGTFVGHSMFGTHPLEMMLEQKGAKVTGTMGGEARSEVR
jgi:hypothetical protein